MTRSNWVSGMTSLILNFIYCSCTYQPKSKPGKPLGYVEHVLQYINPWEFCIHGRILSWWQELVTSNYLTDHLQGIYTRYHLLKSIYIPIHKNKQLLPYLQRAYNFLKVSGISKEEMMNKHCNERLQHKICSRDSLNDPMVEYSDEGSWKYI